jgi:molybdopterin converting factor subunit 1
MPIRVKVLYFGQARDASGLEEEEFSLPDRASIRTLLGAANSRHPSLVKMNKSMKLALNEEIAKGTERLDEGDVVAFLPPVAGG